MRNSVFFAPPRTAMGLRIHTSCLHEGDAGASTVIDGRRFDQFLLLRLSRPEPSSTRCDAAAHAAIDRYGVSASASRLVAGERPVHRGPRIRARDSITARRMPDLCQWTRRQRRRRSARCWSRAISSCTMRLAHNSIVMGAQLSARRAARFPHNDMAALDAMLQAIRGRYERVLIVAEGLYSMDGDVCDLPALVEIEGTPRGLADDRRRAWARRARRARTRRVRRT